MVKMVLKWVGGIRASMRRGLAHILVGLSIGIAALFVPRVVFLSVLGAGTFVFLLIELLRFMFPAVNRRFYSFFKLVLREQEISHLTGASYLLLAALISFVVFTRDVAVVSICFLAMGDSLAAIISEYNGRKKLFKKTMEGNIACLAVCLVVGFIFYYAGLDISILAVVIGAFIATVAEALPLPVDDNLTIPLFAGLAMTLVQILM